MVCSARQVVLPLLQNEVVATGWVSQADFLTGLALVQAMPGPLFNFAAYLGAPSTPASSHSTCCLTPQLHSLRCLLSQC